MMSSSDQNNEPIVIQPAVTSTTTPSVSQNVSRKVSINSDKGLDNPAYEHHAYHHSSSPRRKVSSNNSEHSEIGPVRRKSILHNAGHDHHSDKSNGTRPPQINVEGPTGDDSNGKSWLYSFCMQCRNKEDIHSDAWEPPGWQKICPFPFCPPYRQVARVLSIVLIGFLLWVPLYAIVGESAAPGGQLFSLVVLTVAANFGGWIISLTTLPRLIGMLFTGILLQNVGWVTIDDIEPVTAELRRIALTIILVRAGLEMDPEAFKKIYKTILKLAIVPWIVEAAIVVVMAHYLLGLPWLWSCLMGTIFAAVSPAVVVACLYRLRIKGYGVVKGIPTLIIAVSGIDDALSVAVFGILSSLMFAEGGGLAFQISQAPVCIFGGLGFGILWGCLSRIVPEKGDEYVVPIRTLMLFGGGLLAIYGSEELHYEGAGPLGCVFAAFTSSYFWCRQGWDLEDNPVSTAFEIFWMIFEPILFGVTGATVKISLLDPEMVKFCLIILFTGVILRILSTIAISFGDKLNWKERVFVSLSWMSKATVQAALGPVALRQILKHENEEEFEKLKYYADAVLVICILSIVVTAPIGAILISITGTKLLKKTKQPVNTEGWRRSHRPSLHDISIIDEEEERDDPESPSDKTTRDNTASNRHLTAPSFTITK
ncbi:sodium/hydrogen exchanger 9B2 [Culicoides brevitarsis]|uniref:sodium/hydrogen exchanger 9B2 n=1 Tax=Culicoides brevitarsis TaxID=469753 RepID=UPI00307BEAD3